MMRRAVAALIAVLAGTAWLVVPASPASAHASLTGTSPAANSVVPNAPKEVVLTFSEPVNVALGRVTVLDPDGVQVQDGKAVRRGNGSQVAVKLRDKLPRGTFVISFRVVSADGHPISGGVVFSIGAPSRRAATVDSAGSAEIEPAVRALYTGSKYVGYLGLAMLVGGLLVLLALWPRRLPMAGPRAIAWLGWGLLFAGTSVSLLAQVPYGTGTGITDVTWDALVSTATSGIGTAQLVRLAILLAAVPLVLRVTSGKALGQVDTAALWTLFAAALLTWPLAGHAAASPGRLLTVPADALHVGAMAIWLGGLAVIVRFLLPSAREEEAALILPVWSRWALYAVVTLAITGVVQALVEVGTFRALLETSYGQLVVAKIAGLALIVAVAFYSRQWVQHRYAALGPDEEEVPVAEAPVAEVPIVDVSEADVSDAETSGVETSGVETSGVDTPGVETPGVEDLDAGARSFRRGLVAEIAIGAVLLAVAAALVQAVPGRAVSTVAQEEGEAPVSTSFSTVIKSDGLTLQVQLDPAAVGGNSVHLYAFEPDGEPLKVLEWRAFAALPKQGVDRVDIPLLAITSNHAVGEVQLPKSGEWTFSFTVRMSDIDQKTLTKDVRIG